MGLIGFMRGKFIIFLLFTAVIVGLLGFWYYQRNLYSKEGLKLEILGPAEAQLLELVEYTVKFKNNGNVTLEEPELAFEFPEYSVVEGEESLRRQLSLEDIYPGEERSYQFKTKLIGKEGAIKKARAVLSYRPKSLKAFYESQTTLTTLVKSVPLSFELDVPSKTESGREIKILLNYFSNLQYPISDLRVKVVYPSDFEFIESRPSGLEESEWEIGLLNKAEGGRIEVKGKLSGGANTEKVLRASLGVWREDEFVLLKETARAVKITKPLLSVFQRINGLENYTANLGEWLHYEIFFRNIGEEPFRHLFLISYLEGKPFDFHTLKSDPGQFNEAEQSIIWDWRAHPQLQFLDRGEEGKIEFWIKLKDLEGLSSVDAKSVLRNKVIVSEIKEQFETKIQSKLELSQLVFFEDEVFGNEGVIPPQAGRETTYTVVWQAKNCCSDVKDVKVKAVVPAGVKLTGKLFPKDLRLTFDSGSREIVWLVGDFPGGKITGLESCAFQISLTPTSLQRGKAVELIGEARITGEDQWTEEIVGGASKGVDTTLPDDKTITEQQGVVQ